MVTETLDRRLLQIVQEQQSLRDISLKNIRLLATLKEAIISPIDVFYILSGGLEAKELFVDSALSNHHTIYLKPPIIDYDGKNLHPTPGYSLDDAISRRTVDVNPQHFALLVDDLWNGGTTIKKTVKYLEN